VLILTGGDTPRPFAAAALVKAGFASQVLVTHVKVGSPSVIPECDVLFRRILVKRGVPSSNYTVLPAQATTTYDEAQALKQFLKDKPDAKVIVLSNDFHTRRSRWIFQRVFGKQASQLSFVSAPLDGYPQDGWWRDEEGVVTIGSEYLKLIFYIAYYGCFRYWVLACSVLMATAVCTCKRTSRVASVSP
jgi:uncharacterized SAM-binding protein YcdF (DUF218 family)